MSPNQDRLIARYGVEIVTQVLRPLLTDERVARIEAVLDARLDSLTVALENPHDPHNGAAAVRSLEAIGVSALHVAETTEAFRFGRGVTIGCERWMDIHRYPTFAACATALRQAGFRLYAAYPGAGCDIESIDVSAPAAVIFGNEHMGLTPEALATCDERVTIPMHGFTQSFNLSVSIALAMYRLAARRRAVLGASGDMNSPKRALLRARWYAQSIRGAEAIVDRHVAKSSHRACPG